MPRRLPLRSHADLVRAYETLRDPAARHRYDLGVVDKQLTQPGELRQAYPGFFWNSAYPYLNGVRLDYVPKQADLLPGGT